MSVPEGDEIELSSESEPEDLDLEQLQTINADAGDIDALDRLIATTKQQYQSLHSIPSQGAGKQIDLFLRNFFIKHRMSDTLQNFQQEWHQLQLKGTVQVTESIPEVYVQSEKLHEEIRRLKEELDKAIIMAQQARGTYNKLLKEKNFHKMHHQRVQQEKKKLNGDLERLRDQHVAFEAKYDELADKYTHLVKEKMLIKLERDRLKTRAQIQREIAQNAPADVIPVEPEPAAKTTQKSKLTPFPSAVRENPRGEVRVQAFEYKNSVLYKTWKPHTMAITSMDLHPRKPILATGSDDLSWKILSVPQGELVMSSEGHAEWVSSTRFHPRDLRLLTASGDATVKLWDLANYTCLQTFRDHSQAVWDVAFHDTGDFFASASMDHLGKIFDVEAAVCRHSLRGHVDSVNAVNFQPFSNILATASADKTVSLWDCRTSLCVQTFYGHGNSVNDVKFNPVGDKIASCDSDGILKLWDVRMVKEKLQYDCDSSSANAVSYDCSGTIVAVALASGEAKIYNQSLEKLEATLKGHQDSVQDIVFDQKSKSIFTCGADCTFRIWQ